MLLLQVFVGLSFPYEGPAPLEALANGCIFLNPRLSPPQSSLNSEFFKGKPNTREVSHTGSCFSSTCLKCLKQEKIINLAFQSKMKEKCLLFLAKYPFHDVDIIKIHIYIFFLVGVFLQLTSQHPYAEAIGEPYVFMVDMHNQTDVHRALTAILNHSVSLFF